jgi:hypothetical protein
VPPAKKFGWVNVYSEENATELARPFPKRVACVKIEWTE